MTRRTTRPGRRLLVALLVGGTVCACSSKPSVSSPPAPAAPSAPPATPSSSAPGPTTAEATAPLTGLPVSADASREPVVAVPVQTGGGRTAPVGLAEADLAYVAFPGPDRQRVVALYQSRDPGQVGPVAQTRPMDGKLVGVFGAVLQYRGGAASFVRQLARTEVVEWSSLTHSDGFTGDASGSLFASPDAARAAPGAAPATPGLLAFTRTEPAPATEEREVQVTVPSQPSLTLRYDPDDRRWEGAMGDLPLAATNVVLQEVEYEPLVLPQTGGATEARPGARERRRRRDGALPVRRDQGFLEPSRPRHPHQLRGSRCHRRAPRARHDAGPARAPGHGRRGPRRLRAQVPARALKNGQSPLKLGHRCLRGEYLLPPSCVLYCPASSRGLRPPATAESCRAWRSPEIYRWQERGTRSPRGAHHERPWGEAVHPAAGPPPARARQLTS